ncbi:MAG: bacterial Ig-like domain-containing protein [Treponema sp.]|nr:bacterial Ig-like domain-containing protein [Treponema sp.]
MKKFRSVLTGVLSALVLGGGVFLTSCSDGGDGSTSSSFTSVTKEIANDAATLGAKTTVVESSDAAKATVAFKDADKSAIVITSKAAGEATITAKETAEATDSATIKVVVASDGKITATVTKKIGENPTPTPTPTPTGGETVTYAFDDLTSVPETVEGDNSILDGKVIYWVAAGKTGNAKVTANSDATHHYLQVSAGGSIAADATTVDISTQTTLLKVKAPKAGKEKITFTFTTVKGGSDSQNRILIVDPADGKILGQTAEVSCGTEDDNTEKTLSVEATVPETFLVVFARSNGKGGFKFTKFEQVNTDGPAKTLTSIAVTTEPTVKSYAVGDSFNKAGLVVTATYSDNSTADVTEKCTLSGFDSTTAGDKTITVTYKEGEVEKTVTFTVNVDAAAATVTGIAVKTQPTKVSYKAGEKFDPTGLVITVSKSDNTSADVAYNDETKTTFTFSPDLETALTTENTKVTVTYSSKTADVTVTVVQVYSKTWSFKNTENADFAWDASLKGTSNPAVATATDYYYTKGLYIASSEASKPYLRTNQSDGLLQASGAGGFVYTQVQGPFTVEAKVTNTGSNAGRTAYIVLSENRSDLFAYAENAFTKAVGEGVSPAKADDTKTLTYAYTGTSSVYVGVAANNALRLTSFAIKDTTSNIDAIEDAAKVLAFAKADWAAITADTSAYKTLNQYDYVDVSALTTALAASVSGEEYAPYLTAAKAVYTAYSALVKYAAPTAITVSYKGTAVVPATGLNVNYNLLDATTHEIALTSALSEGASAHTVAWAITGGTGGLSAAAIAADGKITGVTDAAGTATVTASTTVRKGTTTDGVTHYSAETETLSTSFTLTLEKVDVNLLATDTVTATAKASGLKVTLGAVIKHAGSETAATDITETLTYTWYDGETDITANVTNNEYTTTAGDHNFKVKVTSPSNSTGIESAAVAVTTKAAVQWHGTLDLTTSGTAGYTVTSEHVLTTAFKTAEVLTTTADTNSLTQVFNIATSKSNMQIIEHGLKFQKADTSLSFETKEVTKMVIVLTITNTGRSMAITCPEILSITGLAQGSSKTESAYTVVSDGSVITVTIPSAAAGSWTVKSEGDYTVHVKSVTISAVE